MNIIFVMKRTKDLPVFVIRNISTSHKHSMEHNFSPQFVYKVFKQKHLNGMCLRK